MSQRYDYFVILDEGKEAFRQGLKREDCPYIGIDQEKWCDWNYGFTVEPYLQEFDRTGRLPFQIGEPVRYGSWAGDGWAGLVGVIEHIDDEDADTLVRVKGRKVPRHATWGSLESCLTLPQQIQTEIRIHEIAIDKLRLQLQSIEATH